MNIKSVVSNPVLPIDPKNRVEGGVRTQGSTDRDANGKRENAEEETKKKLTDFEFEEAFKVLKSMPGLKSNELTLRTETSADGLRTVYIEDHNGQVIRRLTEGQLWLATRDKDRQTGTILDKAM
jgi:hypothetical protein